MYRVNVSFFLKYEDYPRFERFLRSTLIPLIRRDEGVVNVHLLDLIPQVSSLSQPIENKTMALLISLYDEEDFKRYFPDVLKERIKLVVETFGESVLYHTSPMKEMRI